MNEATLEETIYSCGSEYFSALLDDIAQAKRSIILETYTFNKDNIGKKIAQALIAARARRVRVRILVDGVGTPLWGGGAFTRNLEKAGIETKVFHPLPWGLWQWSRSVTRMPLMLKLVHFILHINTRNHRKICIIDRKILYLGSMNITEHHLKIAEGGQAWRDTGIRCTGARITDLLIAFEAAWNARPLRQRLQKLFQSINTDASIRLNNTRHKRRLFYKNLLKRIAKSKYRVWITNAYFVPDNFLLKKLKDAALAGIDVRILLPKRSDVFIMPWASNTFYRSLLKSGIRIFEYLPSILHAKTLIVDDWMTVGTSNLNHRSLLHDLEVDLSLQTASAKHSIQELFLKDLTQSKEIRLEDWRERPLYQRWIGGVLLYMKYWI